MTTSEQAIDTILAAFKDLGDLDKLAVLSPRGFVKVRFGFVVSLFFLDGNTPEKRLAFTEVVRHYYGLFGQAVTHYQKILAGRLTPIEDASFLDHYEQNATRPVLDETEDPDINFFGPHLYGYPGGEEKDEPSLYYCGGSCRPLNDWFPAGSVSFLDAYIPASWVAQQGYPALIDTVRHWCGLLQPMHGTAGLGTLFNQGDDRHISGLVAFPLIKRFPGLDYSDSRVWCIVSKADNRALRTTNWLTILDAGFVRQLGGRDALEQRLGPACPIHDYDGGVIVQAGPQPELGDVNHGRVPEHYRTVARTLAPLRFESFRHPWLEVPDPLDGLAETLVWVRRLD